MNYEIVELEELSGPKTSIYSVIVGDESDTLFDNFLIQYQSEHAYACKDIVTRLETISKKTGARETFFRLNEGAPGDGVCALYDLPNSTLRLYCIRFGDVAIILGGGGPKTTQTWQQDPNLSNEVRRMMSISKDIMNRLNSGDIRWSNNGMQINGDLNFNDDEHK